MAFEQGHDSLKLSENSSCLKMLKRFGDNYPNPEKVILSIKLIKINKKEKEQRRILLLTDKALYNLKANQLKKPQRRIEYKLISSISISTISDEMTVHCLNEYDYRFKTSYKHHIANVLSGLATKVNGKIIKVNTLIVFDLSHITINKNDAKEMTIKQREKLIQSCDNAERNTLEADSDEFIGKYIINNNDKSFVGPNPVYQINNIPIKTIKTTKITQQNKCIYQNQTRLRNLTSVRQQKLNLTHIYRSYSMFSQQSIIKVVSTIDYNDKLLINGYLRNIDNIDNNIIINYCLLYYCAIFDSFSKNNNKRTIHGNYSIIPYYVDNNNTYLWKLKINSINKHSLLFVGIDDDLHTHIEIRDNFIHRSDTINYGFGGSTNIGYNIWSQNKICGKTNIEQLSKGDYIEIIFDLSKRELIFVINADQHISLKNINIKTNNGYKLAMYLQDIQITLQDFIIYNASYYDVIGASSINIKNAITYSL